MASRRVGPPATTRRAVKSPRPLLRLHQIRKNIVDPRQVPLALGPQPTENPRVQAYAHGNLPRPSVTQPYHGRQLFIGQPRDVFEVNARVVPCRLTPGNPAQGLALLSVHRLFLISSDLVLFSRAG